MSRDVGITLTGVQKLDKTFDALPDKLRKQALRKGSREVAKFVQRIAESRVPVDTGSLRSQIKVRSAGRKHIANALNITHRDAAKHFIGSRVIGGVRDDGFYGLFLEFGTDERETSRGHGRGRIEDNEFTFLRPALYRFKRMKRRMFEAVVRRWLRQQNKPIKKAA